MADPAEGPSEPVESLPFEDSLERLEQLVSRLEQGDLQLEESLEAFEQGVRLMRHCAEQLERAERRIEELVERGGELFKRPFDALEDEA
jgi:exodeoxyribonuclease VII small subunit